ncbi:MAG TPA: ISL3 family transposase [Paludibacter sp.]|nr:ISL3 family transposase [Paludibacter sp.]
MQDTELYRYVLGIEDPWRVDRISLNVKEERIDVWAVHGEGLRFSCPECGISLPIYDHAPERVWRHLDTCQFKTFLHARIPRVECPTHGVKQVRVNWAEEKSRFTALFERLAILVLQETNIEGGGKILRISWDEAWHIVERAVGRGQKRKKRGVVKKMGVDEKSLGKGHNYLTLIYDLERSTVEHIEDDRKKESLDGYFRQMKPSQRAKIKAIATDIWDPYLASIREYVAGYEEKLVFDRYHLMTHMIKAVDMVRKQEHRDLRGEGNEILSGTKYLWLYSRENLPAKKRRVFSALRKMRLRTARAWAIKEELRRFWSYQTETWARKHFSSWYGWAIRSRLNPVSISMKKCTSYRHEKCTTSMVRSGGCGGHGFPSFLGI